MNNETNEMILLNGIYHAPDAEEVVAVKNDNVLFATVATVFSAAVHYVNGENAIGLVGVAAAWPAAYYAVKYVQNKVSDYLGVQADPLSPLSDEDADKARAYGQAAGILAAGITSYVVLTAACAVADHFQDNAQDQMHGNDAQAKMVSLPQAPRQKIPANTYVMAQ